MRAKYISNPIFKAPICAISNGIYSDIWRVHLLQKTEFMWVDLDVYCLRPIDYEKEFYFGINYKKGTVNNCVLKLPRHSVALHLVRNFLEARVPIPFWWHKPRLDPLLDRFRGAIYQR